MTDGRRRLQSSPEFLEEKARVRERVLAEFAPLLEGAGFLRGRWLMSQMWRRIRGETERLAPRAALYIVPPRPGNGAGGAIGDLATEYRGAASATAATDCAQAGQVERNNRAVDRMREIARLAIEQDRLDELLPLLDEPDTRGWLAHQIIEMAAPDTALEDRCIAIIEELAAAGDLNSIGESLWLKNWRTRRSR